MKLKINPVFRDLIPSLSPDEYKELESSILREGCRDSIIAWNGTIVDGHNRYAICIKHNVFFSVIEKEFSDESEAKIWIIKNQFGRRNINNATRAMLALELEPLIAEAAKKNQIRKTEFVLPNSAEQKPMNTRKEVAKLAGVATGTIYEVKKVKEAGTEETKQRMLSGQISVHKAYTETFKEEGEKKCSACGKIKPVNDFYSNKVSCKECELFMRRHRGNSEVAKRVKEMSGIDTDDIIKQMARKEPSEEGRGNDLDNLIIYELGEIIKAFRVDINKFLYMSSAFSNVSSNHLAIRDLSKAKEEIEKIINYAKGE